MTRRLFSLFLAFALLCTLLPQVALPASAATYSGSCGDNLTWSLNTETGLLTIVGSGEMANYTNQNRAPWYDYCESITAVSLPNGLTSIGAGAFWECSSLTDVTIPAGVTSIGMLSFYGCYRLAAVTVVGSGLTSIGAGAFWECSSLTDVTIPDSVTSIGEQAFDGCSSLTDVTIPAGVTSIGDCTFSGCRSLTGVTIPAGVTSIGEYAFNGCRSLTGVTIPAGVTSIGEDAFFGCSSLTGVTVPAGVTSIGSGAFSCCTSLTAINVASANSNYIGVDGVLFNKARTELIQYPAGKTESSYQIPASVTSIGDYAFRNCGSLTGVTIPTGVTSIGDGAFRDCYCLSGVVIPDSVTGIGNYAFFNCGPLTSVIIPGSVTSIGEHAFEYCYNLTSVTIDEGVTSIGDYAFCECTALTDVTIPASVTGIGNKAFGYYYGDGWQKVAGFTICGYIGSAAETYATENEFAFVALEEEPDVVSGTCGAEGDGSNLTWSLAFNTGLLTITGSGAMGDYQPDTSPWYEYSKAITAVSLPAGLTNIGMCAFYDCGALESVTIPDSVTSIGESAFLDCSALTSVTIPASVTGIGNKAFGYYYGDGWQKVAGFTIYGYIGTAAETYATANGFQFVSLSAPVITAQPRDYTGPAGTKATFTVAATGSNLTYQWYSKTPNGVWTKSNFAGNTTATLTVSVTAARNGYQYRCVVSNEAGAVTSNAAMLHVVTPLTITTQPQDYTGPAGTKATFTVKATGENLTFL